MNKFFSLFIIFSIVSGILLPLFSFDFSDELRAFYVTEYNLSEEIEEEITVGHSISSSVLPLFHKAPIDPVRLFSARRLKHDLDFYISEYHRLFIDEPPEMSDFS